MTTATVLAHRMIGEGAARVIVMGGWLAIAVFFSPFITGWIEKDSPIALSTHVVMAAPKTSPASTRTPKSIG